MYSILSIICLASLIFGSIYFVSKLCRKNRRERIDNIKAYKNGKCAFIFIPTLILMAIGCYYNEPSLLSILKAIPLSLKFVVLGFDLKDIQPLFTANKFYKIAIIIDCILAIINAGLFAISLFKQKAHIALTNKKFSKTNKDVVLIVGVSAESKEIYKSVPKDKLVFLYDALTKEDKNELYNDGFEFLTLSKQTINDVVCSIVKKKNLQHCDVVIHTGNDTRNILFASELISKVKEQAIEGIDNLSIYVFGTETNKNLFFELEDKGLGCVHYMNEYKLCAVDFIEKHPIASFFSKNHVDYSTATVDKDIKVNFLMVGFGRANTELFIHSVSNDQFVTKDSKGKTIHKPVNYYLFDKKAILESSNLNYNYNRYEFFLDHIKKRNLENQYLGLAPIPANTYLEPMLDIDSKSFYNKIRTNLAYGKDDINFISVALGDDIKNIDLANKIASKSKEWGLKNTKVFARVRNSKYSKEVASSNITLWGDTPTCVFNYETITRKDLEDRARTHNESYEKTRAKKESSSNKDNTTENKVSGFALARRMQRASNFYACLNLKTKLSLIGINLNDNELTVEYIQKYIRENLSNEAKENLARQEHYRWNAHYICNGFIPASIEEIKETKNHGKDFDLRKHPNILECDALKDFENMTGNDVIKYDFLPIENLEKDALFLDQLLREHKN